LIKKWISTSRNHKWLGEQQHNVITCNFNRIKVIRKIAFTSADPVINHFSEHIQDGIKYNPNPDKPELNIDD